MRLGQPRTARPGRPSTSPSGRIGFLRTAVTWSRAAAGRSQGHHVGRPRHRQGIRECPGRARASADCASAVPADRRGKARPARTHGDRPPSDSPGPGRLRRYVARTHPAAPGRQEKAHKAALKIVSPAIIEKVESHIVDTPAAEAQVEAELKKQKDFRRFDDEVRGPPQREPCVPAGEGRIASSRLSPGQRSGLTIAPPAASCRWSTTPRWTRCPSAARSGARPPRTAR